MASVNFRLKINKNNKKIDAKRNYLLDEIKHNGLMSEEYKKSARL